MQRWKYDIAVRRWQAAMRLIQLGDSIRQETDAGMIIPETLRRALIEAQDDYDVQTFMLHPNRPVKL